MYTYVDNYYNFLFLVPEHFVETTTIFIVHLHERRGEQLWVGGCMWEGNEGIV